MAAGGRRILRIEGHHGRFIADDDSIRLGGPSQHQGHGREVQAGEVEARVKPKLCALRDRVRRRVTAVGPLGGKCPNLCSRVGDRDRQGMLDHPGLQLRGRDQTADERQRRGRRAPQPVSAAEVAGILRHARHRSAPVRVPHTGHLVQVPELPHGVGRGLVHHQLLIAARRRLSARRDWNAGSEGRAQRRRTRPEGVQDDGNARLIGRSVINRDAVGSRIDPRPIPARDLLIDRSDQRRDQRSRRWIQRLRTRVHRPGPYRTRAKPRNHGKAR